MSLFSQIVEVKEPFNNKKSILTFNVISLKVRESFINDFVWGVVSIAQKAGNGKRRDLMA